jgi:hypothetical protein
MDNAGALRATKNKGLQPAMDFILEHNEDPIPDSTSGAAAASSAPPHSESMAEDNDVDVDVLRSAYALPPGSSGPSLTESASSAEVEAKVSRWNWLPYIHRKWVIMIQTCPEHQMLRVRQDIQERGARQFPCRKEWARSV